MQLEGLLHLRTGARPPHLHGKHGRVLAQEHLHVLEKVLEQVLLGAHLLPHRFAEHHLLVPGLHGKHQAQLPRREVPEGLPVSMDTRCHQTRDASSAMH